MIRGLGARLREFNRHRTTDVFVVGYPKTGNTWVRFLVGRYLQLVCDMADLPLFDSYDAFGRCERAYIGPSMHFTHAPLSWNRQTAADLSEENVVQPYQKKRVVLVTRHPLDALASHWFQLRFRGERDYTGDLVQLIEDPVFGLEKLIRFHDLWAAGRHQVRAVMLIRYEDLRRDTLGRLSALLEFLGIPPRAGVAARAVEYASFESMRALEASGAAPRYRSSGLGVFATGDPENPDSYHVRRGLVGGYREHLSREAAAAYEARIANAMDPWYGYR